MSSSVIPSVASSISGSFAGVSKFASSLQSVLSRSVGIAALPYQSLNAGLTTLTERQSAIQALDANFLSLQGSVSSLQSSLKTSLLSSSVSDGSIVSATVATGALAGTYSIEVESLGAYSTASSIAGSTPVRDPSASGISSATTLTLHTGSVTTTITPTSTSLSSLVDAINSQASDQVQATLVNVGSTSAPDYRLSLRAVKLGTGTIDLTDTSGSLIVTSTAGSLASYKLNGLSSSITSDSRTVTLGPGLTADLLGQSATGKATTIVVSNNSAGIASALSSFARTYNSAVDGLAKHHGESAGALRGDSVLLSLSAALGKISSYSNGTPEGSLAGLGLALDKSGHLSLDNTAFAAVAKSGFSGLLSTLGSADGRGFLKIATDVLADLENSTSGVLKGQETAADAAIVSQKARMAVQQERVSNLQASLTAQLAKADAAIAQLESQVSYVTGIFAAFTRNTNSSGA